MKLYPKKLKSIEELELEKRRLKAELASIEKDDLFSVDDLMGDAADTITNRFSKSAIGKIMPDVSGSLLSVLTGAVSDFAAGSKKKGLKGIEKKISSVIGGAAKEFVGGYLKWKAIELSYKGIKMVISRQKKKKAEKKASAEQ